MSRHESDREDLLREATALVERAEVSVAGYDDPIVAGFRKDGSASFYFGADLVCQFNAAGELRRAYVASLLYKAERGRLVALRRQRSGTEIALIRSELSDEESAALVEGLRHHLSRLRLALAGGSCTLRGQIPPEGDILGRIQAWLAARPPIIPIARAPNVGRAP
jgi:hypothetical protein